MAEPRYVELHARSAFNFLRGASMPEHLAEVAAAQGHSALAVHDRDGVYGAPRFHKAAREAKVRPIIGCELTMEDGSILPLLVETRAGYRNLCRLLTRSRLRGTKAESQVGWDELSALAEGLVALTGDADGPLQRTMARGLDPAGLLARLTHSFGPENVFLEMQRHLGRGEQRVNEALVELAGKYHLPLLATNGVTYAEPAGRAVADLFTCIRHHTTLDYAGRLLSTNSERHLKSAHDMAALFADLPEALENTVTLSERLDFSLEKLGYEFPRYPVPDGETMPGFLIRQTMLGAKKRYGTLTEPVLAQLNKELELINRLGFAGYFLIVWDLVNFCREQNIMVQGRGSAANSAVCYSLGITCCDPISNNLLFERFLSESRKSWPDIDLDLPSGERREKVIQEVYQRYGRHGAAMTANVIAFRGKSAMREAGKALGFPEDVLERFSHLYANGDFPHTLGFESQMEKAGIPQTHPRAQTFAFLCQALHGMPRHLGQHSGGMIICQGELDSIVPLENASMPGRVVAQWDKDDCEDLGIKVNLVDIPTDDPAVYDMLCAADTIGVFQVESRAQMATLPRMKPRRFYDLVIEVAIIRPGPIQGHLMHPYLRRRAGKEPPHSYTRELEPVLARTLGVPLFQEQMLKMEMVIADFTGEEAEELRRALSFHRSQERMHKVERKLRDAMLRKQIDPTVIEQIIGAITSFALYGFPESHAISFAHLAYCSAWLKVHRAPEFYASLLSNQPMGFYSPATLIQDARRHGVKFRPVSIAASDWNCSVEADDRVRLGLCVVEGLSKSHAAALLAARDRRQFESIADLRRRAGLNGKELRVLAEIGALNCLARHRRDAQWLVEGYFDSDDLFSGVKEEPSSEPLLQVMTPNERLHADYEGMRLSLAAHPMASLRSALPDVWRAADLETARNGQTVRIGGSVICRQRPGTAKGFVFVSLEDETGVANAIVNPLLFEKMRLRITEEPFLLIEGRLQKSENVIHIMAGRIEPLPHPELLASASHDFR
jgi:error-prone DNA polymerase